MGNRSRHHRRHRPTVDRATAEVAAAFSCGLHGCTCESDVKLRHTDYGAHVTVEHDDWCPMAPDNGRTPR